MDNYCNPTWVSIILILCHWTERRHNAFPSKIFKLSFVREVWTWSYLRGVNYVFSTQ
jgi:hypothetical protein